MLDPSDFDALTFDCYGTLIDWETGITRELTAWLHRHRKSATEEELLEAFAESEARVEAERPGAVYRDILRQVLRDLAERFGLRVDESETDAFAGSVADWPAFLDTAASLRELKKQYRLVVVSNVDRASFAGSLPKLGVELDAVVMAEEVGAYKPDLRMFQKALEVLSELGVQRSRVLHVAQSLYHDHVPAKKMGLKTVWVNRRKGIQGWGATRPPDVDVRPDMEVVSLSELVDWMRRAIRIS